MKTPSKEIKRSLKETRLDLIAIYRQVDQAYEFQEEQTENMDELMDDIRMELGQIYHILEQLDDSIEKLHPDCCPYKKEHH